MDQKQNKENQSVTNVGKATAWLEATIQFVNVGEEDRLCFVAECMDEGATGSAEAPVYVNTTQGDASSCSACAESILQSLFFPDSAGIEEIAHRIEGKIERFTKRNPGFNARVLSCRTIRNEDWATLWRGSFPPERIGMNLWTVPPWENPSLPPEAIPVILEPGLAFGTGKHATTRQCLQFLEEIACNPGNMPRRFLDIGCGSGILSIAAALLGAGRIIGLEIDPDALSMASKNLAQNGLTGKIRLVNGGPECCRGNFELIAANLTATILLQYADQLPLLLTRDGACILSGILLAEKPAVLKGFLQSGLRPIREKVDANEGWVTILLRRTGVP